MSRSAFVRGNTTNHEGDRKKISEICQMYELFEIMNKFEMKLDGFESMSEFDVHKSINGMSRP